MIHSTPARVVAGRASGKRTLAEVMDQEASAKKKKREDTVDNVDKPLISSSRFFRATSSSDPKSKPPAFAQAPDPLEEVAPIAGSSRSPSLEWEKENIVAVDEGDDVVGFSEEEEPDVVTQEEGYLSPTESFARCDTPELSSPVRPGTFSSKVGNKEDDDFGADVLSSPPTHRHKRHAEKGRRLAPRADHHHLGHVVVGGPSKVLVFGTPPRPPADPSTSTIGVPGPDLRDVFEDWTDLESEIDECCDDSLESAASSHGPITPELSREFDVENAADLGEDEIIPDDAEQIDMRAIAIRNEKVANGWWEKYSRGGNTRPGGFPVSNS